MPTGGQGAVSGPECAFYVDKRGYHCITGGSAALKKVIEGGNQGNAEMIHVALADWDDEFRRNMKKHNLEHLVLEGSWGNFSTRPE